MATPIRCAFGAVLCTVILAAGCQRDRADDADDTDGREEGRPAPRERAPADEPGAASERAPAPTVELLSAGAEPRRELRYELTPGQDERVTIELDMEMAMSLGDEPSPPVQLPRMQMILDIEVDEAEDDTARYSFQLSEAKALADDGVDPSVLRAIEQGLAHTVGTRGSAVVDKRGFNRDTTIEIPEDAPPETRQMMETTAQQMEQLASPLPAEPVGEGARWEVVQHIEQNGISLVQTSVMTLESLEGNEGKISASIRQEAEPQVVDMPGAMAGARAELLELRSRGDGEITFDLGKLMPVRGDVRTESESRFQIDAGGTAQPMSMHMDLAMTLTGE